MNNLLTPEIKDWIGVAFDLSEHTLSLIHI